jgi:hypothetical protein
MSQEWHIYAVVATALVVQAMIFGTFFYLDARQTVAPDWNGVLRFGLHPLVVLFYGLTPIPIWWSYRTVYQAVGERFWLAILIQGLMLQVVYLVCSYLGSRQVPTQGQIVGLVLAGLGALVAGLWR